MLLIISLLIATPFIYSLIFKEKAINDRSFKEALALLKTRSPDSTQNQFENNYNRKKGSAVFQPYAKPAYNKINAMALFYFDPNTLPAEGWKKLGLADKTIATIKKYLGKGGKFREPADIKKIWGLQEEQVNQLLPYVKIEKINNEARTRFPGYEKKEHATTTFTTIEVNEADSAAFLSLPGIGPGYAMRIIKFRKKLGGFYNTAQISETFGLPDSTFQKIKSFLKISGEKIKKININTAALDEFKEHPYIRYQLANAITQYRIQHGNFKSVDGIKNIMLITDEIFLKLAPYLTID